jgi:IclR family pca regulon transcriptional regulator
MLKKDLLKELDKIRVQGFSTNHEETIMGLRSVAAPVKNPAGEVVAAVNIIVPCIRASKKSWRPYL